MSPVFVTTPFLVQKALKTANSKKFVFSCQTSNTEARLRGDPLLAACRTCCCWCALRLSGARASKFARFPPKTGSRRSPCSEFRFPAEIVAACHRFVTTRFLGAKVRKTARQGPGSVSDSPPRPAKLVTTEVTAPLRSKRSSPKSPFFVSDCKWDAQASKFSVESGLHTTTLLNFPLSGRKSGEFQPAEHERTWFLASLSQ